jgi:tryptophan 7-halogenase
MAAPLSNILIVGGGTAGWMAAVMLNRVMRRQGTTVTLVESADIGTIGVGEATIPSLVRFVRHLGVEEADFMRRCSATYKLGILFSDWIRKDHRYWHMFGPCGGRINGLDLFHFWMKMRQEGRDSAEYSSYSLQTILSEAEKGPRPIEGDSRVIEAGTYAYHLDAAGFATYLREIATSEGVIHIYGNVREVQRAADGSIAAIDIGGERQFVADFYVDCTGFAGVLVEKALEDRWIDWSNVLLCDPAVVLPLPRSEAIAPYTRSTALEAGWMWQIPLSTRTGNGYVHSSAHIEPEAAAEALIKRTDLRRARAADPRFLRMRVGRRTRFWLHNCVAVGLSSGFIEPLESTGIHLIQRAIELLIDHLPDMELADPPRRAYNRAMAGLYDEVRDFVLLHYYLTRRDEPFWRDSRAVPLPDSLSEALALYKETGKLEPIDTTVFADTNYFFILAGGDLLPRRTLPRAALAPSGETRQVLDRIREQNMVFARAMPSHRELIDSINRPRL